MERCLRHRLQMSQFPVFACPEEPELAPFWAAGVARDGRNERNAPTEAVGSIIASGQEAKTEFLVRRPQPSRTGLREPLIISVRDPRWIGKAHQLRLVHRRRGVDYDEMRRDTCTAGALRCRTAGR